MDKLQMLFNNIYTLTPFVLSALLALLIITHKWKQFKALTASLFTEILCLTLFVYGYTKEAFIVLMFGNTIIILCVIFLTREDKYV